MQNEFEKQVKQKMEELDFGPSAPVWQKIEVQIRQKKDRKRIIFWLPLTLLLLGGGITWLILQKGQPFTMTEERNSLQNQSKSNITDQVKSGNGNPINTNSENQNLIQNEDPSIEQNNRENYTEGKKVNSINVIPGSNEFDNGIDISNQKAVAAVILTDHINSDNIKKRNKKPGYIKETATADESFSTNTGDTKKEILTGKPALRQFGTLRPGEYKIFQVPAISVDEKASVIPLYGIKPDSNAIVSVPKAGKTFGRSKWKFGLVANAGISGAGEGLPAIQLFNQRADQNFSLPNSTPPPPASLYNRNTSPSKMENGFSFGAGIVARKQLGKRFAFQTGVQYQYLSTHIKIGYRTNSLTSGNSTGGFQSVYTPASLNDYANEFHFISVPALFEYQVLKRKPLNVYGGISFRHLFVTNALYYNRIYKLYYPDKNAFTINQVFTELGLSYSLPLKDLSVTAGPHIQFSLYELEKDNANRHLVSVGLKTILLLQKK